MTRPERRSKDPMPRLFLVRHARPSAAWGQDPDPGIDDVGMEQARQTASELAASLNPQAILSSPLRRCRETAQPLEQMWQRSARAFDPVAEIPSPPLDSSARRAWLTAGMQGTWEQLQNSSPRGSPDYLQWRRSLLEELGALRSACVIYTHFIAINVVVAAARGSEQVVCFRPDHASVTVAEIQGSDIKLIALGREAETSVLTR